MGKEYFVFHPDVGVEHFDSIEKANEYAQIILDDCRDDAYRHGEWPDDVGFIRVGVALGVPSESRQEDGSCDYRIEKSSFQTELDRLTSEAADLRRERDELRAANVALHEQVNDWHKKAIEMRGQRDALAARLAEIERSEPAARRPLPADGCGACGDACRSRGSCQLADESPEIEQRGTP